MTTDADRLAQIEARIDRATPGPWKYWPGVVTTRHGCLWTSSQYAGHINHEPDADLIANAPADLRWLIDRLHDAEQIARLAEESEAGWRRDADEAHAALARVKALADEWDQTYVYNSQLEQLRAVIRGNS